MIYEEKLAKVVFKLKEERKITRKGHNTKVTFDDRSFSRVRIGDICKILLKLQDDENIVKILDALQPSDTVQTEQIIKPSDDDDYEGVEIISVEIGKEFDEWHENYLIQQKSNPNNLDWLNLLKVLDVCLDIDQQMQITKSTTVTISSFPYPYLGRFLELFPFDSIGTRKNYQQHRWEGAQYLLKEGVVQNVEFQEGDTLGYGSIEIAIDMVKFDEFYRKIKDEYTERKKSDEENKEVPNTNSLKIDPSKIKPRVTYNAQKGELDIEGKRVKFDKDSFRAKLLELLLKDEKSRKKEWSWDEVIEKIEAITDPNLLKEKKKKFYPACDGLSKFIAQKTGINDFLIYNKSTVQINLKYI